MRKEPPLIDEQGEDEERERDIIASLADELGCTLYEAEQVLQRIRGERAIDAIELPLSD